MFPYHVSVHFDGMFDCGGSLISETFALTAAHCVLEGKRRITVTAGIIDLNAMDNGQVLYSKEIVIHPSFNQSTIDYDIALIRFVQPAVLNANVQVITMAPGNANYPQDTVALITGYGVIDRYGTRQNCLKFVNVPVWDQQTCHAHYIRPLTDRMICAGDPLGRYGPCEGDTGGGLNVNNTLIAVYSLSSGCGIPYRPSIFQSVPYHRKWIDDVMHSQFVRKKKNFSNNTMNAHNVRHKNCNHFNSTYYP
ncbi:trypsin isoform X1 [Drosophila willistoni]|uniref:trypsin isoform X1 n=1 Tax=Drosophila willistoni TaxID=7260 RepID=UPI001F0880CF|nr:trypsin isoform X1 [Drosophila willistoni]